MTQANAEKLTRNLISLPLIIRPVTDVLVDGLKIGAKHKLAIYDSVYIALAKKLSLPLITVDNKQAKAATNEGITLKPITDFQPPEAKDK